MKVEFDNIKIEDFYSISSVCYDFTNGITKVTGKNMDTNKDDAKSSNGSGKSTIFHAVSQCLFNRNIKGKITLDDTYNKVSGNPYCITLSLIVGGSYYVITNNRSINTISVTKDGDDITPKGVKNQLALVESIIQLDFNTFNTLTHLTQKNIADVLDVTSDKNLLFKFFDLDKLGVLEKDAKVKLRELKREYALTVTREKTLIQSINEFEKYKLEDLSELYSGRDNLTNQLNDIKTSSISRIIINDSKELVVLTKALRNKENILLVKNSEMKEIKSSINKLKGGMCPTCDTIITVDNGKLVDLTTSKGLLEGILQSVINEVADLHTLIDDTTKAITKARNDIKAKVLQYQEEYDKLDKQIIVAEERNRNYDKFKDTRDSLILERDELTGAKVDIQTALNFINPLLQVIKSGEVTQIYLENFIKFFNIKLSDLSTILDTDFDISAVESAGGIIFSVSRAGEEISFNLLSSGEQTRVSLIILVTTVLTLELVTNISTNLLVFDELLSVLDDNGLDIFKSLLNNLKNNKSIFVVLHHNEIEQNYFDQEYLITKKDGLSTLEVV